MKTALERLDQWFAQHRKPFRKNLQPGASSAELEALHKSIGRPVPDSLRKLLAWHNGQGEDYVGYFENHWLLMSAETIAAAKQELDAGVVDGWKKEWIPFLDDDGGDYLVIDSTQAAGPVLAFYPGQAQADKVAASLDAWLEAFAKAVEAGEYFEEPERGTFMHGKKPAK